MAAHNSHTLKQVLSSGSDLSQSDGWFGNEDCSHQAVLPSDFVMYQEPNTHPTSPHVHTERVPKSQTVLDIYQEQV